MTSCVDCPDLDPASMPQGWTPRAKCCRDEHIDRRLMGSHEPWEGIEKGRLESERRAEAPMSRQQRRWHDRKGPR